MAKLMQANTVGELHDHVHEERESCKSEPACKPLGRTRQAKARKAGRIAELENALRELLMACTAHGPRAEVLDLFAKAQKDGWRVLNREVQS